VIFSKKACGQKNHVILPKRNAIHTGRMSEQKMPFAEGDLVTFSSSCYSGTGRVRGVSPCPGFGNYGIIIEHVTLNMHGNKTSKNVPSAAYSCVFVPLYDGVDHGLGFDTEPCVKLSL
jgi:hypothetical protein